MHHGSCLCGAVAFEITGPLRDVVDCHCRQCRKQSGHFWAATSAAHADFRLTQEEGLAWYRASPSAKRGYCRHCGSFLFWQPEGEDRISIAVGAFDGKTGLQTAKSIYHEDAGDYYDPEQGPPPATVAKPATLQGGCHCGRNRFTLPGPMGEVTACHCSQCRKTSGHYAASFAAEESDLVWQSRHIAEHVAPGGGRRGFCPDCASSLVFRGSDGSFSVEAGAIDNPTGGRLSTHIFTADKGDYYQLTDGLPQHQGDH